MLWILLLLSSVKAMTLWEERKYIREVFKQREFTAPKNVDVEKIVCKSEDCLSFDGLWCCRINRSCECTSNILDIHLDQMLMALSNKSNIDVCSKRSYIFTKEELNEVLDLVLPFKPELKNENATGLLFPKELSFENDKWILKVSLASLAMTFIIIACILLSYLIYNINILLKNRLVVVNKLIEEPSYKYVVCSQR